MNKKQLAILSNGNISNKDEGIALYASKYLELNYNFNPSIDIIHGSTPKTSLLNTFMEYEEIIVLDAIGIEEAPGSMYQFPMSTFRSFSTNEDNDETGVLGCLNVIESKGNTLPKVSLLAIVPDVIEEKTGLSDSLAKPFEAYILMILKALEDKGITSQEVAEKQSLNSIIESFVSKG